MNAYQVCNSGNCDPYSLSEVEMRRFWHKVRVPDPSTGCMDWMAGTNGAGYGYFHVWRGGKDSTLRAHRIAYTYAYGVIADDLQVDHMCLNRLCQSPAHLRLTSTSENCQNRAGAQAGSASGVRGVSWDSRTRKWRVLVAAGGQRKNLGYYAHLPDAAAAALAGRLDLMTHSDPRLRGDIS